MNPGRRSIGALVVALVLAAAAWHVLITDGPATSPRESDVTVATLGDVKTLRAKYARWKDALPPDADRTLVLSLKYTRGLSAEYTRASGEATFDLVDGRASVRVSGLPDGHAYDVWMVDNRPGPGKTVKPERGDAMVLVGPLVSRAGSARLDALVGAERLAGFTLDLVVVARRGEDPGDAGLLFGSPSLFQRLYHGERRATPSVAAGGDARGAPASGFARFRLAVAAPAHAAAPLEGGVGAAAVPSLEQLIARGEALFFNETFAGNGRTCGTCHPAENNFTIDAAFIRTVPPDGPLFVADPASPAFNPALAGLENPALLRNVGLILENVDGFENPGVLRGTPHTLALLTSLAPDGTVGGAKVHATGWSGDGSPASGSLRDFATGAVTQHFTRSLLRRRGIDFRLPRPGELDALEAFQASLGRPGDPDLATVVLTELIPRRGRAIFRCRDNSNDTVCTDLEFGTVPSGRCVVCHENGGATTAARGTITESSAPESGVNGNFDTGAERTAGQPGRLLDPTIPCDGGFGTSPRLEALGPCLGVGTGHGNGTFNTPPLIEAADTPPFFHNNSVKTLEGAIAFYNGGNFNRSAGAAQIGINAFANGIGLDEPDVDAVAAFLRVLNALENIRNAIGLGTRVVAAIDVGPGLNPAPLNRVLRVARAEIDDAVQVLGAVDLHPEAVAKLKEASASLAEAVKASTDAARRRLVTRALARERAARALMCTAGTVLCEEI